MKKDVSIDGIDVGELSSPLYKSLAASIADMIENRQIEEGSFLPSRKALAEKLGVSVQTVREAYQDLDDRGYVSGEVGRGTRVIHRAEGAEWNTILEQRDDTLCDLSILRPVFGAPHVKAIEAGLSQVLRARDFSVFSAYRPSAGFERHRRSLSGWLNARGVQQAPSEILVTNGATHAGFLALSTLCEAGDVVLTPHLTDVGMIGICRNLGLDLRGVAFDEGGLDIEDFDRACAEWSAKALIITPTLSNPFPFILDDDRRRRLADVAERRDVVVLEDDCFSALCSNPPPSIYSVLPHRTVYYTTFSKVLMSGMRVGCIVPPAALRPRLAARLRGTTWMAAPLLVELVANWIDEGVAQELVEWQRRELAHRQDIVRDRFPADALVSPETGPSAWLRLSADWNAANFVAAAMQKEIAVTSPEAFRVDGSEQPRAVRLCVGSARTREELAEAADSLASILRNPSDLFLDFA